MKPEIDLKMKTSEEQLIEVEEEFKTIWHTSAECQGD